jgi:Na+-transporting methylmalonyl-CoA/oxaloacetate decarboxylase gamma subunit
MLKIAESQEGNAASAVVGLNLNDDGNVVAVYQTMGRGKEDYILTLTLTGSPEKAHLEFAAIQYTGDEAKPIRVINTAKADVLLTHYTGSELIEFTDVGDFLYEQDHRKHATIYLNNTLLVLDMYLAENLDLNVRDLGFIVLSEKYMADVDEVVTEENLGGAFSPARLKKAGIMLLQGMGMVFLVLALLWIVLLIFKVACYKDPAKIAAKEAKKAAKAAKGKKGTEAEQVEAAPAPVAPVEAAPVAPASDDQLIAVITAAVAAAIDSDPALSSQFASGFRVVSFKKTEKSRNR